MKLISIVGARPNFVKMAPLLKLINNSNHDHLLVHTGQHYDFNMSNIFFEEMDLIKPDYNLDVGSGSHAYQTAEILMGIEKICLGEEP
ncbi:MAG: UDP-N-acetylglucosamine 2-epimerase, partial [Asgard group archaeon]|nr:UDP-N-acetylglucosamine 2-epimerase [Asgard group archaeon]